MLSAGLALVTVRAILSISVPLQAPADSAAPFVSPRATDSTLAAIAAREPDSLRAAITNARAAAVHAAAESARAAALTFAARLASSYAIAWSDSFFVRQVSRFALQPPAGQRRWVIADSLRRAGVLAAARAGTPAAMRLWRRSAREFRALNDTAGIAAAVGNLGAGFYLEGNLDSAAIYLERARRLAVAARDRRTEANAVGTLGSVHKDRGEFREAHELYERALSLRQQSGDGRGAASDRNNLGLIAQELGGLDEARRDYLGALAENRAAGRQHSAALNLTNLATLASLTGDSPQADSLYRLALAMHQELAERDDEAVVLHDLALLQMRRAEYDGALASLHRALALTDSTGAALEHLAELSDLASLESARGDVEAGMSTLRRAQHSAAGVNAPGELLAKLALNGGELAVSLNRLADAEDEYARASRLAAAAGERSLQAEAQRGQGMLLARRERYADATTLFAASTRNHQAVGDVRAAAASTLWLGYAQGQNGDTARARRSLSRALAQMRSVGDRAGEAAAFAALGDLDVQEGAPMAAEGAYHHGIVALAARPAPEVAWRLHAGLGGALRARGALPEASDEFRTAITFIERTAGRLSFAEQRESYRADKWDVYASLAFVEQQRRRFGDAFAASERLRARQALELLDRGTIRYATHDDPAAAREQSLRLRIGELTRLVAGDPQTPAPLRGANEDAATRDAARDALADLERRYDALLLEQRARDPASTRFADGAPTFARDVAAQLRPDDVMLEYLITDSASTVFVLTADSVVAIDLGVHRHELASLVDYARDAIAHPSTRGDATWRAPLRKLHRLLVQPVEDAGFLRGRRRMIIVPYAELHFLPFGALVASGAGDHFLIERVTIVTAPSASLWLRLERRPPRSPHGRVLALAPRGDALPASRREVDAIASIYGANATVLREGAATRDAFVAGAPASSVIHLATLGVLNKHNPLFSFVELASHGADDGRLAVTDVLALRLNAQLITLSACQTALGAGAMADVPAGDDWVGFTSAFLRAGARDVMATLWPVEDDATATLMTDFYRAFETGVPAAEALARAQRAAIRDPSRAAPFRWAGFVVTGAR